MLSKAFFAFAAPSRVLRGKSAFFTPLAGFASDAKSTEVSTKVEKQQKRKDISAYVEGQIVNRNHLALKKEEDIDSYVIKTIRNYFRTTNKNGLELESTLANHGLDSLDSIELAMQIEEDLGYTISAEALPVLNKVKHFSNYIKQIEAFKQETNRQPLP